MLHKRRSICACGSRLATPTSSTTISALGPDLLAKVLDYLHPNEAILLSATVSKTWGAARSHLGHHQLHADNWEPAWFVLWTLQAPPAGEPQGLTTFSLMDRSTRHTICCIAASHGHVEVLEWLHAQDPTLFSSGSGLDAITKSAAMQGCQGLHNSMGIAVGKCSPPEPAGTLSVLRWLRALVAGWAMDGNSLGVATASGRLPVLMWVAAEQPGCQWPANLPTLAARGGHVHVLAWLRAHRVGLDWGEIVPAAAAMGGHLPVLQWARQEGLPLNKITTCGSSFDASCECLQYLRGLEPPCPWEPQAVWLFAARNGALATMQWLLEVGTRPESWAKLMGAAAGYGHIHVVSWLRERGARWFGVANHAAQGRQRAILEWLLQHGCPVDGPTVWRLASEGGRACVLDWLLSAGLVQPRKRLGEEAAGRRLLVPAVFLRSRHLWGSAAARLALRNMREAEEDGGMEVTAAAWRSLAAAARVAWR